MNIELAEKIVKTINSQKGQKYPCSNQIVICGFFGTLKDWDNFCEKMPIKPRGRMKYEIRLTNGERWVYFSTSDNYKCRGYRFYKVKVPYWIDEHFFTENIYCYMINYCCEIEFY